ncbi:MAG: hypothetical protein L0Z51_12940 [Candidatus Latescibacteria bacterium]|nr:hypothetical protein [Candidatus Latescibacterota bacterium]
MRSTIVAYIAGLLFAGTALAQEHPDHPKKDAAAGGAKASAIAATVTGENICLGCTLTKAQGAAAQCSKYGHRHALKVTSATAEGSDVGYMTGWILTYLETDAAQPFIKEHDGETLSFEGKIYTAERVLEVGKQVGAKKSEHPDHPKG